MLVLPLQRKKEVDEYAEEWMEVGFNLYLSTSGLIASGSVLELC